MWKIYLFEFVVVLIVSILWAFLFYPNDKDSLTGKRVISADGNEYPIYVSKNGKYYIKRVSKIGNEYKQYLKLDN